MVLGLAKKIGGQTENKEHIRCLCCGSAPFPHSENTTGPDIVGQGLFILLLSQVTAATSDASIDTSHLQLTFLMVKIPYRKTVVLDGLSSLSINLTGDRPLQILC